MSEKNKAVKFDSLKGIDIFKIYYPKAALLKPVTVKSPFTDLM